MKNIVKNLIKFIDHAKSFGIPEKDSENAEVFLKNNEFGLCFDTIITQLYEFDIEINEEFYLLADQIGRSLGLELETYSYIKELIKKYDDKL